ncbi:MAG: glycosyltransferase family 4 protein [Negativicutes bacterium]
MRTVLFHNIMSPYKTLLFNALTAKWEGDLSICYFALTSVLRDWRIDEGKLLYPYTVLNRQKKWEEIPSWKLSLQAFWYAWRSRAECFILGEYSSLPYWFVWGYGVLAGKKVAAIVESQEADHIRKGWKEKIKRLFLSRCFRVIVAGKKHKAYVKKLGVPEERIVVMGGVGGVDHGIYDFFLKKYDTAEKRRALFAFLGIQVRPYFVYVGRFSPEKNLLSLLRVYEKVACEEKGWGLLLVGSGPQEADLRGYVMEHHLAHVVFPGFVQQERLPLYYLVSQVFVLPSLSEPWGLVVDEALALGRPVIVSGRCGCVPDIVHEGENGMIFSPEDEAAFAGCMNFMMAHADLRYMGEISLKIAQKHSPEESAQRIVEGFKIRRPT